MKSRSFLLDLFQQHQDITKSGRFILLFLADMSSGRFIYVIYGRFCVWSIYLVTHKLDNNIKVFPTRNGLLTWYRTSKAAH